MDLRKSDRLIIVVGVIILIVAAIAIFVYYAPTDETLDLETESESGTFYVTWTKETGQTGIDDKAEKVYNQPFTVTAPPGSVLTNVDFRLTWEDHHVTGLILKRFKDTLKAEISLEGGEAQTDSSTGGCKNESIASFVVNNMPLIDSVEANDTYEAEEILNDILFGQDTASFDVKVTVTTGEKIRRPLKFFMDKGNDFKFEIVYEYYYPVLEGIDEPMEEEPPMEEGYSAIGDLFKNLGFGGLI